MYSQYNTKQIPWVVNDYGMPAWYLDPHMELCQPDTWNYSLPNKLHFCVMYSHKICLKLETGYALLFDGHHGVYSSPSSWTLKTEPTDDN